MAQTDFLERTLHHLDSLDTLRPTGMLPVERWLEIRGATTEDLTGTPGLTSRAGLIRGLLFCANDALEEARRVTQEIPGDLSAYLQGMIYRREEDFETARNWFRRAGELPFFAELHRQGSLDSEQIAKQVTWDPYLFTGLCERAKYGARTPLKMLVALQKAEFLVLLDYLFRAG